MNMKRLVEDVTALNEAKFDGPSKYHDKLLSHGYEHVKSTIDEDDDSPGYSEKSNSHVYHDSNGKKLTHIHTVWHDRMQGGKTVRHYFVDHSNKTHPNLKSAIESNEAGKKLNESYAHSGEMSHATKTTIIKGSPGEDAGRDGQKKTSSSNDTTGLTGQHWHHLVHIAHKMPMPRLSEKDSETRQSLKKKGLIERDGADWKPTKLGANMVIHRISQLHKFD